MKKKYIESSLKKIDVIKKDLPIIKENLEYIKTFKFADYPKRDWEDAQKSIEEAENGILELLIDMNKMTEEMIKKIDIEFWMEYKDRK